MTTWADQHQLFLKRDVVVGAEESRGGMIDIERKKIYAWMHVVAYEFTVRIDDEFVCHGRVSAMVWNAWWFEFGWID